MSLICWTSRTQSNLWGVALHRDDLLNADALTVHHDAIYQEAK